MFLKAVTAAMIKFDGIVTGGGIVGLAWFRQPRSGYHATQCKFAGVLVHVLQAITAVFRCNPESSTVRPDDSLPGLLSVACARRGDEEESNELVFGPNAREVSFTPPWLEPFQYYVTGSFPTTFVYNHGFRG